MAESKYGKYILRQTKPSAKGPAIPLALEGTKDWAGIQHRMVWNHVLQPVVMEKEPHTHDFEEFLCFLGSDPQDSFNFGADIELSLGGEKHMIDHTSIVCVPKGVSHGPINFKKVTKPILFCDISMSTDGAKKPAKVEAP